MADISITAANVVAGSGSSVEHGTAGGTITAGQVVYRAASSRKYLLADSNSATAEVRVPRGIALNGASDGQPLAILTDGPITIGGTLTASGTYYLSETPGGIQPSADLGSGEYPSVLGIASSTSVLNVKIQSGSSAL